MLMYITCAVYMVGLPKYCEISIIIIIIIITEVHGIHELGA